MDDARLIKEANKSKKMVVFSLVLILLAILSVAFLYFQLREKERQLTRTNVQLEKTSNKLEIELEKNKRLKEELTRTLEEVNTKFVEPRDIEAAQQIQMQIDASKLGTNLKPSIRDIYNRDENIRKRTVQHLLDNAEKDPSMTRELIDIGSEEIDNPQGTVNNLTILERMPPEFLEENKKELTEYIKKIEAQQGRNQAKELTKRLKRKIRQ